MSHFIDRRLNGKNKSTVNRRRFLRRYQQQIKKSLSDVMNQRSVTDLDSGSDISIPRKDISEPEFRLGSGGQRDHVHPGNDQYNAGDQIARPKQSGNGQGRGQEADNKSDGQDEFVFQLSRDEYLDLLFDNLALPNLKQTDEKQIVDYQTSRAGYKTTGTPSNLDVVRSFKNSHARRIALGNKLKKRIKALTAELTEHNCETKKYQLINSEITHLKKKLAAIPFIDELDLRYKNFQNQPIKASKAVMFCLMDVSGSMDQNTKDIAKRFYILLYLFLTRSYKNVEVVYIRHHTQAKEVDEETFFYSRETGGTIVSSALDLMSQIQQQRFPAEQWNIYAAQASDGDNWADDSPNCSRLLKTQILPLCRYFSYIEITQRPHQSLWHEYQRLTCDYPHFALAHIRQADDIYPVFRELFKQKSE
ncbi:YeaH/YhbH family protein [Gayadomonas joobiniege]|uniref:YeaH/YhbH family protein n=1 Tax=Gayadomonas joobiniege TaxID=1234606 RepID=UPI00037A1D7C|nr:YeaH/YhbH family protein [Gayadomonas joobiniege]